MQEWGEKCRGRIWVPGKGDSLLTEMTEKVWDTRLSPLGEGRRLSETLLFPSPIPGSSVSALTVLPPILSLF